MTEQQPPPSDSSEPARRFIEHFEPILCETDEDRVLLDRLAERVREYDAPVRYTRASDGEEVLLDEEAGGEELGVELENDLESVDTLVCEAPFDGEADESVPDSFATLAGHHNGIAWESGGGGMMGVPGLTADGDLSAFHWDPSYLDHDDNEAYGEALAAAGLDFDDVREAFGAGQNWVVFDPVTENDRGEPALAFVSHGLCELEPIPAVEDLGAGQVLLRLLASHFLEDYSLDPVYA